MKPVYLEFCGINSFSQKAVIDFEKLLSGGVFGIFGDTGSGKSTILDCIHLALYGKIDRAVGSQNDCINYRLDSAYVIFDFEIAHQGARRTYRVHRERKRKASGNKAHLYERKDGAWLAVAEGLQEVEECLGDIIGLSFDDFKKCIALPQGEFAGLVKSTAAERLRLVSRLFDLEKYGEKLGKKVRAKCDETAAEISVLKAQMQQNEDGKAENLAACEETLSKETAALAAAEEALAAAEKEWLRISRVREEKVRYETLLAEIAALEAKRPAFERLRKTLADVPVARQLTDAAAAERQAKTDKENAERAIKEANERSLHAAKAEEEARAALKAGNYDEQLWRLDEQLQTLKNAKTELKRLAEVKEKYRACQREYRALLDKDDGRDFDTLISATEAELRALGEEESLEEYILARLKKGVVAEEYGEFRRDLKRLQERHPETAEDVRALLEKYTADGAEQSVDFRLAKAQFDQTEAKRRQLNAGHADLLSARAAQRARVEKKSAIEREGKAYGAQVEEISLRVSDALQLGEEESLLQKKQDLQKAKTAAEKEIETAGERGLQAALEKEKQSALCKLYEERQTAAQAAVREKLGGRFASVAQAEDLLKEVGDVGEQTEKCQRFFAELSAKENQRKQFALSSFAQADEDQLRRAKADKEEKTAERNGLLRQVAAMEKEIETLKKLHDKYVRFAAQLKAKQKEFDLWDELRAMVKNNQFLEFIASEYLQEICTDASRTLLSLTNGRYFLRYEGEFRVGDNLDGGRMRAVKTLSGGETFLVSLSLALSLSGAICQRSMRPIEFFFLDEGFGTLDDKLIDTVMNVLGKLIGNHFSIGLISHVEELKLRIENKVLVTGATETQSSQVKVIAY